MFSVLLKCFFVILHPLFISSLSHETRRVTFPRRVSPFQCVLVQLQSGYSSVGRASDCSFRSNQMVPGSIPGGRTFLPSSSIVFFLSSVVFLLQFQCTTGAREGLLLSSFFGCKLNRQLGCGLVAGGGVGSVSSRPALSFSVTCLPMSGVHQPGIKPGSHRWQRCILPLDH